ncbi:niemann-Pick type C-related protein 1 [Lecanora helva]
MWRISMRAPQLVFGVAIFTLLSLQVIAKDGKWTDIHEAGRCAIRGQCGKKSFFGSELPCPDNGKAEDPDKETREKLVAICGNSWEEGAVEDLRTNLKRAERIISSCPACKENFFNLFCTFTCSPDQSQFVNVTASQEASSGKLIVTELDNLWSDNYGKGFYDSCKDVTFGATGGKAMDFIGGGAKNYTSFMKFLGDEKFLGSPFQINFPRPAAKAFKNMIPEDPTAKACNDTDEAYRCACVDCPGLCPELSPVAQQQDCHVGALPCLSFAVIIVYCVSLLLLVAAISGHIAYQKHSQRKSERLQLLQDAAISDDEDEEDIVHHAGILERPQKQYKVNTICDTAFRNLGGMCARYPFITIFTSVIIVIGLSIGWVSFEVETDPVRLWVSPTSAAAKEKDFFDNNFGPFYRAEQAFIVNDTHSSGAVLSYDTLSWWFDIETQVQHRLSPQKGLKLDDVCFNPTGEGCVVQSLTGYFGGDFSNVNQNTWKKDLEYCTQSPGSQECLPDFQQPLSPNITLGGIEDGDVLSAKAMIVTWVVNNFPQGSDGEQRAMDWEEGFKNVMLNAQREARERGLRLSFTAESSVEQELNKSTNTDAKIVVVSYIIMFLYASLALGSTTLSVRSIVHNPANVLVASKFTLGVIGILIVLMSVSASVGLFSACGIKVTLIIAEVIPFLVLAVGVDNIFLIVHEFERVNISNPDDEVEVRIAKALGRMGPSILLSALTETVAFALGAAVGMPAVKNFAVYAAGAVLINALLQVTMFVSVLALNQKRVEDSRADCFPFIKIKRADVSSAHGAGAYGYDDEGPLQRFIRKVYAPNLLNRKVKVGVIVLFVSLFAAGLALIPEVALGLDQRIAFPRGSYLIPYFNDLDAYFNTGPPVYFVVKDVPVTERQHQRELCARYSTCHSYSLTNVLEQESKRREISYISGSTASWLDDFFTWLNPNNKACCVENGKTCFKGRDPPWNTTLYGMPKGEEFIHYLTKWLHSPTNEDCPFGGAAPYSNALVIDPTTHPPSVPASHFRTSHTPLRSQSDFISAYASARRIASTISEDQNISVFPYSKPYIFFDQYSTIIRLTGTLLGAALAIILVLTSLLLGSIITAAVVTLTVAMIVIDVIGTMALAHVSLNAISLVNLIICVGISVEFCAHIARAFQFPSHTTMEKASRVVKSKAQLRGGRGGNSNNNRDLRAWTALVNVGGSVFSGITVTKFLGVVVLAFTRSKIFEIYYFRIWVALVVFAAAHALVFLPVALSLVGGEGYVDPEGDGSLEEDLARRRYRALLPEDDESDEDY